MKRLFATICFLLLVVSLALPPAAQASPIAPNAKQVLHDENIFIATVSVDKLNVRRIPSTKGSVRGILVRGDEVELVGRDKAAAWVEAETDFGKGWIDARYIKVNLDIRGLPITEGFIAPYAVVIAEPRAFVHLGPFEEYPVIAKIAVGTEIDVIGLHTLNTYVQVMLPDETIGWISIKLVQVYGDVNDLPTTDKTVLPMARINTFRLRVRALPSTNADTLAVVRLDEFYTIVEQTPSELWYRIEGDFGTGWIEAAFVRVVGVKDALYK